MPSSSMLFVAAALLALVVWIWAAPVWIEDGHMHVPIPLTVRCRLKAIALMLWVGVKLWFQGK